jgi:tetratricopeptide (TPR) repeat protein
LRIDNIILLNGDDLMKLLKTVTLVIAFCFAVNAYSSNWYADEHFALGKVYYQNGQYNKAIKEFQEAVVAYETYVSSERAPERGEIYFYIAKAYFNLLDNYAINNPSYNVIKIRANLYIDKAINIQADNPIVREYYDANPNAHFDFDELSLVPEVKELQEMKNLKKIFEKKSRSNMFLFSRNLNMKHNILEMTKTFYTGTVEPATTPDQNKPSEEKAPSAEVKQKVTPPASQQPGTDKGTLPGEQKPPQENPQNQQQNKPLPPPTESKDKAQEIQQKTEEIMPTTY